MNEKLVWEFREGSKICTPLYFAGHYVISHWNEGHAVENFILSFRPPGQHHHVGQFTSLKDAQNVAERHNENPLTFVA